MVRFHGIFTAQPNILEGQIIQEAIDQIRVKVVPTGRFSQEDMRDIVHRVRQRLGQSVQVQVETVQFIPRTSSGKIQAVISHLH
jgi:phenylacetate-CoA ligase